MSKHRGRGKTFNNSLTELVAMVGSSAKLSAYDTITYSTNTNLISLNHLLLAYLYVNNGIFQAAILSPIQDALSKGIEIKSDELDSDDIDQILEYMESRGFWQTIIDFEVWRNLFGGAGIVINTTSSPDRPLTGIRKGEPFELYDIDRWQLSQSNSTVNPLGYYDQDPEEVEKFSLSGVTVDSSRIIIGKGKRVPWQLRGYLQGWGMSEAERMIRDLNNYLKTQNVLYEILDESKVDVYYLKGLYDAMKTGATTRVADRIQRANQLKNYLNALVLDLDDKYESKTQTFSGLAEVMNENRIGIAAALRRPMTKLFGLSPAGFSNGDSDLDTYYQLVESEERTQLKPVIRKVIDLVCQHLFGFIPSYKLSFPPLKQLSEKDQEEIKNHRLARILQMKEAQMITAAEAVEMAKKENILDIKTATELSITPAEEPETMYRVEKFNSVNNFDESKRKRNRDGTFASKGGGEESKKLPYDKSTEYAKHLTLDIWGTEAEIREKAKPIRFADNREEATKILKSVMDKNKNGLKSADGVKAILSRTSIKKIISSEKTSFNEEAHFLAAANIDKLFASAKKIQNFEFNPEKPNNDLKERKYLYAPMEWKGKIIPIKFTVKIFSDKKNLYSIEAIEEIIKGGAGHTHRAATLKNSKCPPVPARHPKVDEIIANIFSMVNLNIDKKGA